jgi:hypothetical protein
VVGAVIGSVEVEPLVARLPDHAPEAVQELALLECQVKIEVEPLSTPAAVRSATVGAGVAATPDCARANAANADKKDNCLARVFNNFITILPQKKYP